MIFILCLIVPFKKHMPYLSFYMPLSLRNSWVIEAVTDL